jgi:transcriptional regulator
MPRHNAKTADLLQGTLDMLILKTAAPRPIHGYAIVQRIQQISKDALEIRQGSLYPALYRLEKRGWLKSEWKTTEAGREARYYSITKGVGDSSRQKRRAGSVYVTRSHWFWRQRNELV